VVDDARFSARDGERRQISVLFCDMVGSTQHAKGLKDPEDLRDLMHAFHSCVRQVVGRYQGGVFEKRGDGAVVFFGRRQAHEDDTEQAIRAGLDLVDSIARLETHLPLRARVGIATGTVVVGEASSDANGLPMHLAERLQKSLKRVVRDNGGVLVCANTRQIAGENFVYRDVRLHAKDFRDTLAWRVLAATHAPSRFDARHPTSPPELIGRDSELEQLLHDWSRCIAGEGRAVVLLGDGGIGKSHIVRALQQRLRGRSQALCYFCSPHHKDSALFPVIAQLERDAAFLRGDSAGQKRSKLKRLLEQCDAPSVETIELVADLLRLPSESALPLDPKARKAMTLEALLDQTTALARKQPVLVICEDAHWIDPTSLEYLCALRDRIQRLPVLLVITTREPLRSPWTAAEHPCVEQRVVEGLPSADCAKLVARVAAGTVLSDAVVQEILVRANGVPLFVEECTKTVLEAAPSESVPTTLVASLMAQLDRLTPAAKQLAQVAAAVGRDFSPELLQAVSGEPAQVVNLAVAELLLTGLVLPRSKAPMCGFKHALVRDVAYESLLKNRRARLHAAIADALESRFPEVGAAQPETLARHLGEAGLARRAIPYWLHAGQNAARRSAHTEAIAHLQRGIALSTALPDDDDAARQELELHVALGPCLIETRGPASSEARQTFTRAYALCERLGITRERPDVRFWFATACVVRGELEQALEDTQSVRRDAQANADLPALLNSTRGVAMILMFMGRIVEARKVMQESLDAFETAGEAARLKAHAAGQDAGAAGFAQMSWLLWLLGDVQAALEVAGAALDRATASAHPHTEAYASYYVSVLHALRGEAAIAHRHASRCFALSRQHGFSLWLALSRAVRGTCQSALEPDYDCIADVTAALDEYRVAGSKLGITVLYVLLCRVFVSNGRTDAALDAAEQGLALADQTQERVFEAELCRLKAHALLALRPQDARAWFDKALTVARAQGAETLASRIADDIASLEIAGYGANSRCRVSTPSTAA